LILKARSIKTAIHIEGVAIPVLIRLELGGGHAYSINGRSLRLRLPVHANTQMIEQHLIQCRDWVEQQVFPKKPALREAFMGGAERKSGDILTVGERQYRLEIAFKEQATNTARHKSGVIFLQLNPKLNAWERGRVTKTLLSRVVARDFLPEISERVLRMNEQTFRQPISSVNLKYNHSNWGSCSSHANVNLSTRLLFAPRRVQDYVILHELAHLLEMNHSDRFWKLVEQYMPDYQEQEKWLKKNRQLCDF
jgi:predicted metal-dependent hydrolase